MSDWFRLWRVPLRKFLLGRVGVPTADLDDVAQEVFLRLMRYDNALLVENPQAYLFKMASNLAAEWAIRARHRYPHQSIWLAALVAEEKSEAGMFRDAAQAEVKRAIDTLTARQREVLKLFFSEGLDQREIAKRLGDTPRSVRRQLAQSYAKLRMELDVELIGMISDGRE